MQAGKQSEIIDRIGRPSQRPVVRVEDLCQDSHMPCFVVVMGVAGAGKTTIGRALAECLGCPFFDGDDFLPPECVAKMAAGNPLNDADRAPWLARLHDLIRDQLVAGQGGVLACSALKRRYRDQLRAGNPGVRFVHLRGDFDLIRGRMVTRQGHFMSASMLQSQFDTLEPPGPDEAITLDIADGVEHIVAQALAALAQGVADDCRMAS